MKLANPALETLRKGGAVSFVWLLAGSPELAEVVAQTAPQAVMFDDQHGPWDVLTLHRAIGMVSAHTVALVRVAENTPLAIGRALDAGALGVLVPLVETAAEARAAVAAARFPPAGIRSGGGVRPLEDPVTYFGQANSSVLVGIMIETARGMRNLRAITAVEGVDAIFVGTGDLALSLGTFPRADPKLEAAIQKVRTACRQRGVAAGVFTNDAPAALARVREGFQFVSIGADSEMVRSASRAAVAEFGRAVKRPRR